VQAAMIPRLAPHPSQRFPADGELSGRGACFAGCAPSMAALVPVMKDARGEAKNPISSATSCGSPTRPSTVVTARSSNTSGSPALVYTGPDEMELTRMPAGQYSAAGASQRGQCCLGGAVAGIIGLTDDARPAGEVDDHALTTAHHFRAQRRHQQIRGFDVRGKQLIQRVDGQLV
jgi:hypothetical protein